MIYIASDHGGFALKEKLKLFLTNKGQEVKDIGPKQFDAEDDYPDYAIPLAWNVASNTSARGILLCRNGQGVCIAANKVKGVRAVTGFSLDMVASTRAHDNANVLCLPADYISENEAKKIIEVWLKTKFTRAARHVRRLKKISRVES